MAKFTDCENREWDLRLTRGLVAPLREAGFDLNAAARGDAAAFAALDDPEAFGRVLWVLCEKQATARGLSPERFADGFDGPATFAALDAFEVAYTDFSYRPAVAAALKAKLPGVTREMERAAVRKLDAILSGSNGSCASSAGSPAPTGPT